MRRRGLHGKGDIRCEEVAGAENPQTHRRYHQASGVLCLWFRSLALPRAPADGRAGSYGS
jgi:hypothetical protein